MPQLTIPLIFFMKIMGYKKFSKNTSGSVTI